LPISKLIITFAVMNEFSVLMSVYKNEQASYLTACFDSICQQTLLPNEIVLVEDGPLTPELYEAIAHEERRLPILKRIVLPENQGLGIALNKGLQACSHDIVARMDTDDICLPNRFKTQIDFMICHPEIDVLGAWIEEFDHTPNNIVGIRCTPEYHDEIIKFGKKRNPINHPVVMFRKKAVMEAGNYQPCYLFEDYYLWGRMLQQGYIFHNLQEILLQFRRSPEMIKRRGGINYALYEIIFLRKLQETRYISSYDLLRNISQRTLIRIIPNGIRNYIYKKLLRTIP